jgi:diguanylate cyclase (GGDEF)-like protein
VDWIRQWWRQPDHYKWLSAYLAAHGLQRFTRYMIAGIVLVLGMVPVLVMIGTGTDDVHFLLVGPAVIACCLVMAGLWLTRWPTRGQSAAFAVGANVCIAASCLAQTHPAAGLQGTTAFAALAGYVAFFHTSRYLASTLLVATCTAIVLAIQNSENGNIPVIVSKLLILFVCVLAVPFSAQVLVHILGTDALKSDTDPLTELPNRRAFNRSVRTLAAESVGNGSAVLAVLMIDLDAFKRVNDTAGHAAGDQTLIEIAGILRRTRRNDSITARIGGEEFVIAVVGTEQAAIGMAERLRRQIAATTWNVTASVGVATAALARVPATGVQVVVQDLVEAADRAMYQAKRAGGDQVYVAGRPEQSYVDNPIVSRTTATNGNTPWTAAERALSGDDASSTTAAAIIEPTPAKTRAAPTGVPPEIMNPTPTTVTSARKRL